MTTEIHVAQNNDSEYWDSIISQSTHGTPFHFWKWLKITEKHTRTKLYPIIGMKDNNPIGLLPLFFQKKGPINMVFSPPPHASIFYLGPILIGYNTLKQSKKEINYCEFQNAVEEFITIDLKAHYISIALPPNLQDPRPYIWSGYTTEAIYDYIIDLSQGSDYLLQTLNNKQRQNLNRAKKRGITTEIGGKKEIDQILNLMNQRYAQQGKKIEAPREYFLDIYDAYEDIIKIFIAKVDDVIVSGSIDFQYKDTHYSWIGNPKPKTRMSPSPNDLIIWESIRFASERGFRYYVTMNAAGSKRLHSYFASKFNPELKVHFSVKKNSILTGILEKGYISILKPLKGTGFYQTHLE